MKHIQSFIPEKELAEQDGSEYRFGILSNPGLVYISPELREGYFSKGEVQSSNVADTSSCASFSPLNKLEMDFNYLVANQKLAPNNDLWLKQNGYVGTDGKVAFSDAFIAILSGTKVNGNSLKAPLSAIHTYGCIPKKLLPLERWMTFEQWIAPERITKKMRDLGQEFARRFPIEYEQVPSILFGSVLKDSPFGVGAYAWPDKVNGIYPRVDFPMNHAFTIFNFPKYQVWDSYTEDGVRGSDFTKNLAPDYKFYEWGYRVYIASENKTIDQQITLMQRLIALLVQLRDALKR